MTRIEKSISTDEWVKLLSAVRQEPRSRWVFEGDHGRLVEGPVTHVPALPPAEWEPGTRLFVGEADVGEPILIGLVRSFRRA